MLPQIHEIRQDVTRALQEDIGTGDVTAELLPKTRMVHAKIISREPMLVCGRAWVDNVFLKVDPATTVHWLVEEAQWLSAPQTLCTLRGFARSILTAERCALNFLQTLSATATQTRHYIIALQATNTRLLDTRKTIPGLRLAQKYAVACAGGKNHRFGLYDAFLIKENHIAAAGSIHAAVTLAKNKQLGLMIEVEVERLDQLREALDAAPDRIMLDNFTHQMIREAVAMNQPKRCELEVSGGVDLTNIASLAATGVDYISVGAITKSVQAIDLSLLIDEVV